MLPRRNALHLVEPEHEKAKSCDGDRDTHDQRRPLRSGRGTFDRIVDNVAHTCEILETRIRINVDRSNSHTATGALEALESRGLQGKVAIYFRTEFSQSIRPNSSQDIRQEHPRA